MRLFDDKRKTEQDGQGTKEIAVNGIRQRLLGIKEKLLGYIHNTGKHDHPAGGKESGIAVE